MALHVLRTAAMLAPLALLVQAQESVVTMTVAPSSDSDSRKYDPAGTSSSTSLR